MAAHRVSRVVRRDNRDLDWILDEVKDRLIKEIHTRISREKGDWGAILPFSSRDGRNQILSPDQVAKRPRTSQAILIILRILEVNLSMEMDRLGVEARIIFETREFRVEATSHLFTTMVF